MKIREAQEQAALKISEADQMLAQARSEGSQALKDQIEALKVENAKKIEELEKEQEKSASLKT